MKRNGVILLLLAGSLAACVTINIYFPAAAAQEVADEIINEVWQLKEGEEAKTPEGEGSESKDSDLKDTVEAESP